jgi:cyclopropane-fatty-acyl-phospholipid synthase
MNEDEARAGTERPDEFTRVMRRDGFSPDLPQALTSGSHRCGLSFGLRLLLYMLSGLRVGSLDLRLPDGTMRHFHGSEPGPHGVLHIKDSGGLIRHVLRSGEVGIGDAYLDDCWESPDLSQLLMTLYRNEPYYKGPFEVNWLGRLAGWIKHRLRANTRRTARRNIEHHYDLGNDFYKLWLD